MTGRLFIFGLGYSGLEIAKLAKATGWQVGGTVTTGDKATALRATGIDAEVFDGSVALTSDSLAAATHILCSIAPGTAGDPALRTSADRLGHARWLGYLSTTGVYGDRNGGWVDEEDTPRPTQARSIERLATERAWQALGQKSGTPVDIFRLPGIYGPGRSAVDQVKAGTARRIDKPGQIFSRIHIQDIAGAVVAAMSKPRGRVYNVVDDLPASSAELIAFACALLGKPVPPTIPWHEIEPTMSAMARSFYSENRRVRNDRLKRDLGVGLKYPTYREGLRAIAAAG
ncbi:MAG: SDR family oxidoreductase [Proteobacteria bacterium]|nr:SDR family oxidoreductase [Pseudomonadota bacterium]